MPLIHNWKAVLRYVWSIRCLVLAPCFPASRSRCRFAASAPKYADLVSADSADNRWWQ